MIIQVRGKNKNRYYSHKPFLKSIARRKHITKQSQKVNETVTLRSLAMR